MFDFQEFNKIKDKFNDLKTTKKIYEEDLKNKELNFKKLNLRLENAIEARAIFQSVSKATQQNIEERFSQLVSMAIKSVFPEEKEFKIEFVERRNRTEVDCYALKDGSEEKCDILDSSGGGLADVCSFGCRIAFLKLENKRRKILFLDENFKFLHNPEYQERASEMLNMMSKTLGIQFIIVSDQNNLGCDKKFIVEKGIVYENN